MNEPFDEGRKRLYARQDREAEIRAFGKPVKAPNERSHVERVSKARSFGSKARVKARGVLTRRLSIRGSRTSRKGNYAKYLDSRDDGYNPFNRRL